MLLSLSVTLGCDPTVDKMAGASEGDIDASQGGADRQDARVADDSDVASLADAAAASDAGPVGRDAGGEPAEYVDAAKPASEPLGVPDAPGVFGVAATSTVLMRGTRPISINARFPLRLPGARSPLVLFVPSAQVRSDAYAGLLERVASHGFVVVAAEPSASLITPDHLAMVSDLVAVLDWSLDESGVLAPYLNGTEVLASGHALGGKLAVMLAGVDARIKAVLGLDPVNASQNGTFTTEAPDILPVGVANLTLPVGFMGETTDGYPGGAAGQACIPVTENFSVFFADSTSAPWGASWDFTGAAFVDFVDDLDACGLTCGSCRAGAMDVAPLHKARNTLFVAFARRHLLADTTMESFLTGSSLPTGVVLMSR